MLAFIIGHYLCRSIIQHGMLFRVQPKATMMRRLTHLTSLLIHFFFRIDGNSIYSSDPTDIYFEYIKFIGSLNANGERNNATCKKKKEMKMNLIRVIFFIYS